MAVGFFVILEFYRFPDTGVIVANIAVVLFILAAATDALDGYLARRWKVTSSFGRIMDPLCDKLLVLGAFVYLAGPRFAVPDFESTSAPFPVATGVETWMVVVILTRELFVTTVRAVAEGSGVAFGAKGLRLSTIGLMQYTVPTLIFLIAVFVFGEPFSLWQLVAFALIWTALALYTWTLFAGRKAA